MLEHDFVARMVAILTQVAEFVIALPFIDLEKASNISPMDCLLALAGK